MYVLRISFVLSVKVLVMYIYTSDDSSSRFTEVHLKLRVLHLFIMMG